MELEIKNLQDQRMFVAEVEGKKAFVQYILVKQRIIFTHTEVPVGLEGKGVGSKLAKHVLEYAKEHELKVMPLCPFIAGYMSRHPEYKSLLVPGVNV